MIRIAILSDTETFVWERFTKIAIGAVCFFSRCCSISINFDKCSNVWFYSCLFAFCFFQTKIILSCSRNNSVLHINDTASGDNVYLLIHSTVAIVCEVFLLIMHMWCIYANLNFFYKIRILVPCLQIYWPIILPHILAWILFSIGQKFLLRFELRKMLMFFYALFTALCFYLFIQFNPMLSEKELVWPLVYAFNIYASTLEYIIPIYIGISTGGFDFFEQHLYIQLISSNLVMIKGLSQLSGITS